MLPGLVGQCRVVFSIFIGKHHFIAPPTRGPNAVPDAVALRDRFIIAYEYGWSLSDLQIDLDSRRQGHAGVKQLSAEERQREIARLYAILKAPAPERLAAGGHEAPAAPKAPARPKAKPKVQAAQARAMPARVMRPKAKAKAGAAPGPRDPEA